MRKRGVESAPKGLKNLASPCGRRVRCDKLRDFVCQSPLRTSLLPALSKSDRAIRRRQTIFKRMLEQQPWRSHQPLSMPKRQGNYCMYELCPGNKGSSKRQRRGYQTKSVCEECTITNGEDLWLCNGTRKTKDGRYQSLYCHIMYHQTLFGAPVSVPSLVSGPTSTTTTVTPESSPAASPAASPAGESGESML